MLDRFGNATKATWAFVYRQLAFNTDPGVPRAESRLSEALYTQWLMAEEPEQAKYTTDLDILPQDIQQNEQSQVRFHYQAHLHKSIGFSALKAIDAPPENSARVAC
jgi:hypothetical protein